MTDKVVVTNVAAQKQKYGGSGYSQVLRALRMLVAADEARGMKTIVVDISDPSEMRRYRGTAVSNHRSEVQNKNAIDRICEALEPDYLLLMDGPDVIPHILLNNPIPKDRDRNVPSDLPYASDAAFAKGGVENRDVATYSAVTRVVGRIPGATEVRDPASLISQMKSAAAFKSRRREDYLSHFAISSYLWRSSTERSIDSIFRTESIKTSPPTGSPKVRRLLAPLSHFINCDGGKELSQFFGRR